jgi:hypothetical protein
VPTDARIRVSGLEAVNGGAARIGYGLLERLQQLVALRALRDFDPAEDFVSVKELTPEATTLLVGKKRRIDREKLKLALS